MSPLILFYISIIAVVVLGIVVASILYLNRRRGKEPAGQAHAAPPLPKDTRPPVER